MKSLVYLLKRLHKLHRVIILICEKNYKFRKYLIKSGILLFFVVTIYKMLRRILHKFSGRQSIHVELNNDFNNNRIKGSKNTIPSVNKVFLSELYYLVSLMFPKIICKSTFFLITHTSTLLIRTYLSIYVARLEGSLTKNIVQKNFNLFSKQLVQWLLIAVPATSCNSLIRYLESQLDIELKSKLVESCHKLYFENRSYYQIALQNLDTVQIDQNLTGKYDFLLL
jgi:ABC-type uncharacterized transport system fused permease/ATPase subunit